MARTSPIRRREFVALLTALGTGASPLATAAAGLSQDRPAFTREMMIQAEELAGISLTDAQRDLALPVLQNYLQSIRRVREMNVPQDVPPALFFIADPAAAKISRRDSTPPAPRRTAPRTSQGGRR